MKIDIHAHILPRVDDGAKNEEISLKMLVQCAQCGITEVIATPHYIPWRTNVDPEKIKSLCSELKQKLEIKHGITMDIYPGNEIYYSLKVVEDLKKGKALTLAGSRYVLVEFDPGVSYQTICRAVKDFRDSGYHPIIAHVERYGCMMRPDRMHELKDMGVYYQVNVGTLQKSFFDKGCRFSKRYLKKEMIDFVASDMHDMKERSPMSEQKMRWMRKHLKPAYLKALLCDNSKKIISETKA